MPKITDIKSTVILNSRAEYTIKTWVYFDGGVTGSASVPEGASKGHKEAVSPSAEIQAHNVNSEIKSALVGKSFSSQKELDEFLIQLDGMPNKSRLGGNSLLSVSMAYARASALSAGTELYQYLGAENGKVKFPVPVFNILNGGKHAHNGLSFQEFMVIPSSKFSFRESVDVGVKVYKTLKAILEKNGFATSVGDEGGFAPEGLTCRKALDLIKQAVEEHYQLGEEVFMGMDAAAESFYLDGEYVIPEEGLKLTPVKLAEYYQSLIKNYPIIYLEDPFYEEDREDFKRFTSVNKSKLMIVADDLTVTNSAILSEVIKDGLANAVIAKPNQIGTVWETLHFVKDAQMAKFSVIISHRSGDTEDSFIADLAVAVNADFVKFGSPDRGERTAKYNRLLELF